jgi:tripartite-type tricarboxylate transporter receptor subunit TctC
MREDILRRILTLLWAFGYVAALTTLAQAQSYPNRPVKIVCGFPAGSSLDITTRIFSQKLEEIMGQPFVVENRAGATGNIAAEFVARAAPDGYTLMTNGSSLAISASVFKKLNFDVIADFEPVGLISLMPMILVVNSTLGVSTVSELIALAKSRPGELTYGSAGVGTVPQLSAELFNLMAGVKINHVPYRGTNQVMVDLLAGRVSMIFAPAPTLVSHRDDPRLKILAVTTTKPSDLVPGVQPLAKLGLAEFDTSLWNAIWAPKGTPKEVVATLNKAVVGASNQPAVQKLLADSGVDAMFATPEEFGSLVRDEVAKWKKVVDFAGVKIE